MNENVKFSTVKPERLVLLHEIGRGGSSIVYLVQDRESGECYAMKVLKQNMCEEVAITETDIRKEASILETLGKERTGIPAFYGMLGRSVPASILNKDRGGEPAPSGFPEEVSGGEPAPSGFLMEYIEGESLQKILEDGKVFKVREAAEAGLIFCAILKKLHGMNPPLIYRDFKPANILRRADGSYVLIDYGACRTFKKEAARDTKMLGTEGYAAPEQYGGWEQSDVRTDIYGIGAVLHHMLTGRHPLETGLGLVAEQIPDESTGYSEPGFIARHMNLQVDPQELGLYREMDKVLRRCCSVAPDLRFSSCAELERALRKVLDACDRAERAAQRGRSKRAAYRNSDKLAAQPGSAKPEALREQMWHKFVVLAASALIFLFGSGMFSVSAAGAGMARYHMLIREGAAAQDPDVKKENYRQAIRLRPEDAEGYIAFLADVSEDGVITQEERESFEDLLFEEDFLTQMRENAPTQYARLELAIGKSYWAFYDGGTEAARQAVDNAIAAGVPLGERKMAKALQEILGETVGEARILAWCAMQELAREEAAQTGEWDFALAVSRMALSEIALREEPTTAQEYGQERRETNDIDAGPNTAGEQDSELVHKVLAEARTLCEPFEEGRLHAQEELVKGLREAIDRIAMSRK